MSDDSLSPASLEIDLAKSFQPSWAQESDSPERISRLVEKHGSDDRPERGGKFRGRESGPGRQRQGGGPRGPRDERQNRRDDRKGGGQRDDRKGGRNRDRRDDRREPRHAAPPPELKGWSAQIQPHRAGVDGLTRQIKTGAKAYPLFDLARLVLDKPERYLVEFQRAGEASPALFQVRADGSLWLSENEAVSHVLAKHLDKFYRRERVAVEPPKGNFSSVAVCGFSGELLGPSNHHAYQDNLRRLHAARFANMSFEAYKSRVRIEKDEALLARWKEEQSSKEVFHPLTDEAPEVVIAEAIPQEVAEAVPQEVAAPEEAAPETAPAEGAVAEEALPEGAPSEGVVAESETTTAAAPAGLASLAEVTRHFRANHAGEIVLVRNRVKVPGPVAINASSSLVHNLVRRVWNELQRFPLPLAHVMGQQLTAQGLQIFKAHDNVTYVSLARPHYLDRVTTPISEALSAMLDYIESNPSVARAEQWKALVALRPLAEDGDEAKRESAVAADLAWLLHGGHVIDYAGRGLQAARRAQPRQGRQQPEQ